MSNETAAQPSIPLSVGPGTIEALHGLGYMINALVVVLHEKGVIDKTEFGDRLHRTAALHPGNEFVRTMAENYSPTGLQRQAASP